MPSRKTIKSLENELACAQANLESYAERNNQVERELVELKAIVEDQKRQIGWHKQLTQDLTEAVCAYAMRSR